MNLVVGGRLILFKADLGGITILLHSSPGGILSRSQGELINPEYTLRSEKYGAVWCQEFNCRVEHEKYYVDD